MPRVDAGGVDLLYAASSLYVTGIKLLAVRHPSVSRIILFPPTP